jgi:hypothetical protein
MVQSALKLNAMNLPLIRTFISNSISTALYEYGMFLDFRDVEKNSSELTPGILGSSRASVAYC